MATLGTTTQQNSLTALIGASDFGPVRLKATLTGGNYVAGTILGRITTGGKLTAYNSANVDGSEVAVAVLLEDSDASAIDQTPLIGFAGVYLEANMTGLDASAQLDLETKAIYFN